MTPERIKSRGDQAIILKAMATAVHHSGPTSISALSKRSGIDCDDTRRAMQALVYRDQVRTIGRADDQTVSWDLTARGWAASGIAPPFWVEVMA